jgi:endonuclease/exonuclease/phosphatase family metal-dependent hydrolase
VKDVTQGIGGTFHHFGRCEPAVKIDYILSNGLASNTRIADDPRENGIWYSDHYAICTHLSR